MASASASSSLSATSDPFNLKSDINSDTELTEESETTQNKTVVLLLDWLKSPTVADISRPRKIKRMILLVVSTSVEVCCHQIQKNYLPVNVIAGSFGLICRVCWVVLQAQNNG